MECGGGYIVCRRCGHFSRHKLRGLGGTCKKLPHRSEMNEAEKKRDLYQDRLLHGLDPLLNRALPPQPRGRIN